MNFFSHDAIFTNVSALVL